MPLVAGLMKPLLLAKEKIPKAEGRRGIVELQFRKAQIAVLKMPI
jgi:hypothetical protein